jgi:lysophospholipase L1-like esterase
MATLKGSVASDFLRGAALFVPGLVVSIATVAQPLPAAPPLPAPQRQLAPAIKPLRAPVAPAPALLQPIAPGSVQQRAPLAQPQTSGDPKLWTFAALKAEAVGPTAARLTWLGRTGAAHYRVLRNDVVIAELPAGAAPLTHLDDALVPGQTAAYVVEAMQQPTSDAPAMAATASTSGSTAGVRPARLRPGPTVLEASQRRIVVTPALVPPRDFSVAIVDLKQRIVRASWSAPQWASSVELLRNGVPIASAPGSAVARLDDAGAAPGTHRYALRTVFRAAPTKPAYTSAATPELSLRTTPFMIVAVGDSIMWGQGLAEGAKFTSLTRDALRSALGVEVTQRSFAHSGAVLVNTTAALPPIGQQEPTGFDQNRLITPGEIPNGFPTILHQINVQAAGAGQQVREADLVLIDGCINDVGVLAILDPTTTSAQVAALAQAKCAAMAAVLQRAHEVFPNAAIVVTGYYPIASMRSDLTAIAALLAAVSGGPAAFATPALQRSMAANSAAFASASNAALAAAAVAVNTRTGVPGLVTFAPTGFGDTHAYAAPNSQLWLIPTGLYPGDQDDVIAARRQQCNDPAVLAASIGFPVYRPTDGELAAALVKCPIASMGHPNRRGAQLYANAIAGALQQHVPRWREQFAQTRRVP